MQESGSKPHTPRFSIFKMWVPINRVFDKKKIQIQILLNDKILTSQTTH